MMWHNRPIPSFVRPVSPSAHLLMLLIQPFTLLCATALIPFISSSSLKTKKVLFSRNVTFPGGDTLECFSDEGTACEHGSSPISYAEVQLEMYCLPPGQVSKELRLEDIKAADNLRATVEKVNVVFQCIEDDQSSEEGLDREDELFYFK